MRLLRKYQTFFRIDRADRWLIVEAILALFLARLVIVTAPFRLIAPWLRRAPEASVGNQVLVARVRRAVTTAARNVPWNAVCLPQAMAAKFMLARRGCGSAFHLGANFNAQGKLIAHAWLVAGGVVVVGAAGIDEVTPLARFG